jgi:hypothetical protein
MLNGRRAGEVAQSTGLTQAKVESRDYGTCVVIASSCALSDQSVMSDALQHG